MSKFRKKPVVIEAVQWTGGNTQEVLDFCSSAVVQYQPFGGELSALKIPTLEGDHTASAGDWIIRGIKGEFYPCKPDIFAATYESASAGIRCECPMCEHHESARKV